MNTADSSKSRLGVVILVTSTMLGCALAGGIFAHDRRVRAEYVEVGLRLAQAEQDLVELGKLVRQMEMGVEQGSGFALVHGTEEDDLQGCKREGCKACQVARWQRALQENRTEELRTKVRIRKLRLEIAHIAEQGWMWSP